MFNVIQIDSNRNNSQKISLEKESFFELGVIPKDSDFWRFIERKTPLGKTDLVSQINLQEV